RSLAFLVLTPIPLRQVIVGVLQSALHGELIDADQELWVQWQADFLIVVLGHNVRGDFLPVENPIRGHCRYSLPAPDEEINPRRPMRLRRTRQRRSRRQTSG